MFVSSELDHVFPCAIFVPGLTCQQYCRDRFLIRISSLGTETASTVNTNTRKRKIKEGRVN